VQHPKIANETGAINSSAILSFPIRKLRQTWHVAREKQLPHAKNTQIDVLSVAFRNDKICFRAKFIKMNKSAFEKQYKEKIHVTIHTMVTNGFDF